MSAYDRAVKRLWPRTPLPARGTDVDRREAYRLAAELLRAGQRDAKLPRAGVRVELQLVLEALERAADPEK